MLTITWQAWTYLISCLKFSVENPIKITEVGKMWSNGGDKKIEKTVFLPQEAPITRQKWQGLP
jgi:hypothetical protein